MNKKKITVAFVAPFMLASFALGQGARNGTSAASHLLVSQGARYLTGGGAVATAVGLDAVFWNPAGVARSPSNIDAVFATRSYIADINVNYFGAGAKMGRFGSIALTARTFDIGEIPVTDIFNPDGTGEIFQPSVYVVGATYSNLLTDRTSVGISVNYLNEGFKRVGATGVSLDAGVQYSSFMNIPGLTIGVTLKNFGRPMRYSGSGLWVEADVTGSERGVDFYQVQPAQFELPLVMDVGATYSLNLGGSSLDLGTTFENNQFAQDEYRFMAAFSLGDLVSVRGAYTMAQEAVLKDDWRTPDIDESAFELENIFVGVSFGGSLNLKSVTGFDLSLDYAFIPTKFFDDNQIIAVRLGF